jgi:hypothetical protein
MSQWAARKGQSLTARALWRFGPAAATAVLLAMPSLHGGSPGHGPGPARAASHARGPAHAPGAPGPGAVSTGTVSTGTVSTGPGRAGPAVRHHGPGHFIKPD